LIKIHRWICEKCSDRLYLVVDDTKEKDLARLEKFYQYSSMHVLKTNHEMVHTEKEQKGYNYV